MVQTVEEMKKQTEYLAKSTQAATDAINLARRNQESSDESTKSSIEALVAQSNAMRDAANAAAASAEIARQHLMEVQRARVHFAGLHLTKGFTEDWSALQSATFRAKWGNRGTTPTKSARIYIAHTVQDASLPDEPPFPDGADLSGYPVILGPASETESGGIRVAAATLQDIKAGKKRLYIWG